MEACCAAESNKGNGYVIKIIRCKNIPAKNLNGFSDPYVKLKLGGHQKQKTKVHRKDLNPEYNTEFRYENWNPNENLEVSVWDYTSRLARKVFIGHVLFAHPEQAIINGIYPLVSERGQPVGGTIEVTIISEALVRGEQNGDKDIHQQQYLQVPGATNRRSSGSTEESHPGNLDYDHSNLEDEQKKEDSLSQASYATFSTEPNLLPSHNPDGSRRTSLPSTTETADQEKEIERLQKELEQKEREEITKDIERKKEKEEEEKKIGRSNAKNG